MGTICRAAAQMVLAVSLAGSGATFGILVEKTSEMYAAPVAGFKSVVGADAVELNMEGDPAAATAHCQKMKADGCKVVFAVGKNAAKAAIKELAGAPPVVYCMVMNPEDLGAKSGVTGVTLDVPVKKQFEAFKTAVPALKKIGIVYSDDVGAAAAAEMRQAATKLGLTIVENKVASDADVPNAVRGMKGNIDGLYLPPDRMVAKHDAFQFIALFTFENNLPFMAPTDRFVKKGALIALMIDFEDLGKQAGDLAKKIAGGTAVSSLPVEPPRMTILYLNQKTAQTIGINIPPALLDQSQIIK